MKKIFPLLFLLAISCTPKDKLVETTEASLENSLPQMSDDNPNQGYDMENLLRLSCEEARFVTILNLYRESRNLNPLRVALRAIISSRFHSQDMIDKKYFSHTEPRGRTFSERANYFGYVAWAESIAAGNPDAESTFCQWRNSSGHNANMLGNYATLGVGRAVGGYYGSYWSNNFGPEAAEILNGPLTWETDCSLPGEIPDCGN